MERIERGKLLLRCYLQTVVSESRVTQGRSQEFDLGVYVLTSH